ncbi:MAG: IS256 family transposase, partial [Thermodesulfobacteriota bacterium]|nr:IS256 family transposase [Thermodesulfobacteriota bacterium]
NRKVQCGSGEIEIRRPKVTGACREFKSKVLTGWQRKSAQLLQVIPLLYLEGLSTRDFQRALKPLWGESGLSRSSISRANRVIKESFAEWRKRNLRDEEVIYLFLDGYYLGVRMGVREKEGLLLAYGVSKDGKRVLLGVYLGGRESTESWKGVLNDLRERGLTPPKLVITDGNPGLLRALKEIWSEVLHQRCTVHKTRNVLARVPKKHREEVKRALHRIFHAASLEDALSSANEFQRKYGKLFPTATEVLAKGLSDCLTFFRYPERHWKRIRTSNVLERAFREIRRRTDVVGRFPNEGSALSLVFGVLEEDRLKWRGLRIGKEEQAQIDAAVLQLHREPLVIEWAELLEAA